MDFFSTVRARRSIRRFTPAKVPAEVIRNALEAAVLAPNSSNMQTWDFYWVRTPEKKALLVEACLNQSAARTAAELVVVTANAGKWKRANPELVKWARDAKAPQRELGGAGGARHAGPQHDGVEAFSGHGLSLPAAAPGRRASATLSRRAAPGKRDPRPVARD